MIDSLFSMWAEQPEPLPPAPGGGFWQRAADGQNWTAISAEDVLKLAVKPIDVGGQALINVGNSPDDKAAVNLGTLKAMLVPGLPVLLGTVTTANGDAAGVPIPKLVFALGIDRSALVELYVGVRDTSSKNTAIFRQSLSFYANGSSNIELVSQYEWFGPKQLKAKIVPTLSWALDSTTAQLKAVGIPGMRLSWVAAASYTIL